MTSATVSMPLIPRFPYQPFLVENEINGGVYTLARLGLEDAKREAAVRDSISNGNADMNLEVDVEPWKLCSLYTHSLSRRLVCCVLSVEGRYGSADPSLRSDCPSAFSLGAFLLIAVSTLRAPFNVCIQWNTNYHFDICMY